MRSSKARLLPQKQKAALIIGHPSHELRVFKWMKTLNPSVYILTRQSKDINCKKNDRLKASLATIESLSLSLAPQVAEVVESTLFQALLQHDKDFFFSLANNLYRWVKNNEFNYLVGDAYEGYNVTHDICRLLINAVVKKRQRDGFEIKNYEFFLQKSVARNIEKTTNDLSIELSDDDFTEKKMVANNYSGLYEMLEDEFPSHYVANCNAEFLQHVPYSPLYPDFETQTPFYEIHGKRRQQEGKYTDVIYYQDHIKPIKETLESWCEQ